MAEVNSQEKRQEDEQRQSDARFRFLAENQTDYAIFITDTEGKIIEWSKGAGHVFGYREEEAVGQPFSLIFTPKDREQGEPERELEASLEGHT